MKISSAKFAFSSGKVSQIPPDGLREFAFIGRSNVGKSSLINMLTGNAGLAKVSGTPGKTRLINHFLVNGEWYLVDLPGYGYAKTSKTERREFNRLITCYVTEAPQLWFLFVLVDARLEPQRIDLDFMTMLGEEGVPFGVVFTKADKLGTNALATNIANYKQRLLQQWEELPPVFVTSSEKQTGGAGILDFIAQCLETEA
ncbi:MAG: ribosome biogenesis GTP-binding protein YihA/YsxC [Rikenellaceae bacterium]|jgi:GTP-binding protein|nr:ribosome biogenesis GTP-binding protein YihA/YsxC [Rikenellaceae bacterium]